MLFFSRAGTNSWLQVRYLSSTILRTLSEMAASCSPGLIPSGPGALTLLWRCCFRPATLTSKNSSRLEATIQRNLKRSRIGLLGILSLFQNPLVELQQA